MKDDELRKLWQEEETHVFSGWDFSHLEGRCLEEALPWEYGRKVREFLRPGVRLLDMGTGGGEFLLSLPHPPALMSATEGYLPNYRLCLQRLAPLGVHVEKYSADKDRRLPFEDGSFDLVLNRHEAYDLPEIRRVLKKGGFFLTQQVGGQNGRELGNRLLGYDRPGKNFNLENELPKVKAAGFRIMNCDQAYPMGRFLDVGALCFHAKVIQWEFPGFSVDSCFDTLLKLQEEVEKQGYIPNQEHRFFLVAKAV